MSHFQKTINIFNRRETPKLLVTNNERIQIVPLYRLILATLNVRGTQF